MKNEQIGLNYLGFLSTPPTSTRTQLSGGCTTRRSFTQCPQSTFNGNYEGDFTMFDESTKDIDFKSPCVNYRQPIMVDQYLSESLDLGLEQNEEHLDDDADEMVDEEIRGNPAILYKPEKKAYSFWEEYKSFVFSKEQCERIEVVMDRINQNVVYRRISFALKCATVMTIWILRLLLCSVVMRLVDLGCATLRSRNILRSATRRLLWYMTLAKCGDLQLYGLIILLSPLSFLVACLGFIFAAYVDIKNGIFTFIGYVRYRLDVEPPKFD